MMKRRALMVEIADLHRARVLKPRGAGDDAHAETGEAFGGNLRRYGLRPRGARGP